MNKVNEASSYTGGCFNAALDIAILNTHNEIGMLDISTSSFEDDIGLPNNALVHSLISEGNMIIGTSTNQSLQGLVWFRQ
jgi:hypothetical protein